MFFPLELRRIPSMFASLKLKEGTFLYLLFAFYNFCFIHFLIRLCFLAVLWLEKCVVQKINSFWGQKVIHTAVFCHKFINGMIIGRTA